jgi:transposase
MKKKKSSHLVFKPNQMGQLQLPTDLEELTPENHLAQVVHAGIEKMDLRSVKMRFSDWGRKDREWHIHWFQ